MHDAPSEHQRDARYPISRWYVRPVATWAARWLSETWVRPSHLTALGAMMAAAAVAILCAVPEYAPLAAIPVWLAWFCDRADGMLARRQGTVSTWGAWFDANVDELTDLAFQTAIAAALALQTQASWPWFLLVAFLIGKYLLMYGLAFEEQSTLAQSTLAQSTLAQSTLAQSTLARSPATGDGDNDSSINTRGQAPPLTSTPLAGAGMLQRLYHLPGNCDIRIHWLIVMLLLNQLAIELATVALYYNLRWIVRYALVWRRLRRQG